MSDVLLDPTHDDLEAYALGALDADDERRFAEHIESCERCRSGLSTYVPVLSALRQIPSLIPPPAPAIAGTRPAPRRIAWAPFAYAAAAALLLAVGGGVSRFMQPHSDTMLMTVAGMMADGPRQVVLAGQGVRGRVIVGRRARRTAIILRGLPSPAAGLAYHVWFRGDGDHMIGSLQLARNNLAVLLVDGNQLSRARSVQIDLENAGAESAPSGSVVASGVVQ